MDNRIEETIVDEVISIGDYVLNGGELAALVIMEAVARLKEGFIGREDSLDDSFSKGLLEHPQYTRPKKENLEMFLRSYLAVIINLSKDGS